MIVLQKFFRDKLMLAAVFVSLAAASFAYTTVSAMSSSEPYTCSGICIYLEENGMSISELSVRKGETVQFVSRDGQSHRLAEGLGKTAHHHENGTKYHLHDHSGTFVSPTFKADEAWKVQFNEAGIYRLHDHQFPHQNILVVVYE